MSTEKDALQRRGEQKVFKEQLKEIKKTAASAALGQEVSVRAASAQIGLDASVVVVLNRANERAGEGLHSAAGAAA